MLRPYRNQEEVTSNQQPGHGFTGVDSNPYILGRPQQHIRRPANCKVLRLNHCLVLY